MRRDVTHHAGDGDWLYWAGGEYSPQLDVCVRQTRRARARRCGVRCRYRAGVLAYGGSYSLYVTVSKKLSGLQLFALLYAPAFKEQIRLFRLGFPVAASLFFEVTLFAAIAILIAPLGPITVAAHQVAINFSTMIFMLPMSLGVAVSIRVGHLLGKRTTEGAGNSAKIGIWLGVSTAVITALLTVWLRDPIIALYSDNPEVATLASSLMLLAAVYQITDAIQVVAAGACVAIKICAPFSSAL